MQVGQGRCHVPTEGAGRNQCVQPPQDGHAGCHKGNRSVLSEPSDNGVSSLNKPKLSFLVCKSIKITEVNLSECVYRLFQEISLHSSECTLLMALATSLLMF